MKKALIIQNKFIGDVLVSSLIAKNLKIILGQDQVEVHFLCYEPARGILKNNPYIDKVITFDDKELKKIRNLWKLCMQIRKEKFDILIDPYAKLQSRIITLFSNAKIRVSFDKPFFRRFYTHTYKEEIMPIAGQGCTAIENRLKLLYPFAPKNYEFDKQTEIFLSEKEKSHARKSMEKEGIDFSKPVVMIGVMGSSTAKTWPLEYMSQLLNELLSHYDFNFLLNYVPEQRNQLCDFMQEVRKTPNLFLKPVGKNIRELAAILYHCSLFIGNEGGAVNLAKALKIPTFSIFSPHKFRKDWGCYEELPIHRSVHLKEIHPEIYQSIGVKELEKNAEKYYPKLRYPYVRQRLMEYLKHLYPTLDAAKN